MRAKIMTICLTSFLLQKKMRVRDKYNFVKNKKAMTEKN